MQLPKPAYPPPFAVTRASHVVLTVADIGRSRDFYTEVVGLAVTAEESDMLYLRGLEEVCHHSLVLKRTSDKPACERIGLRVYTEDDLDKAKAHFDAAGLPAAWAEVPHQGRTLHACDPLGTPLEFCATMETAPRLLTRFELYRGGAAQRIDHYQLLVPDVARDNAFYMGLGFRLSEYVTNGDQLLGVFLQRKGNPHDIVFVSGRGPRIHHLAYTAPESQYFFRACDIAGNLGWGRNVERGPGRHGPGHALFVYFRDPDGHRVELFTTHYQMIDIEVEPVRWDRAQGHGAGLNWGLPAQRSWHVEATPFAGVAQSEPAIPSDPLTLERFLAARG